MIEGKIIDVLVPYGKGKKLMKQYGQHQSLSDRSRLLHEMGRYSVSLYPYQIKILEKERALYPMDDDVWVLKKSFYDKNLGVVTRQGKDDFYYL